MQKFLIFTFFAILFYPHFLLAQKQDFNVSMLKLPKEVSFYDHQFSGMFIHNNNLLLLSESRLQDNKEPFLYSLPLADIEKQLKDTNQTIAYKKLPIVNLEALRQRMAQNGDEYEGLEAILIDNNVVHITVETATPSNNCYLLKGKVTDSNVVLFTNYLLPLPKPINANGEHIYNAGYEALALNQATLLPIFEYNYFPKNNAAISIMESSLGGVLFQRQAIEKIPFRVTDITQTGENSYVALNYFYKGGGKDEVYRVPKNDKNFDYTNDKWGYKSYTRLIEITYKNDKLKWKPYWEFPTYLMSYNWEAIAAHNKGFFVLNDKYTPQRPYESVLLYLQPK
jgi:hypothetical protein